MCLQAYLLPTVVGEEHDVTGGSSGLAYEERKTTFF